MKKNISKENSDKNLRELSSEVIDLKKAYKKLQDSFVKTPDEKENIKKDEVVGTKAEENKIDIKVLCRQLEKSREYCKEQFLHLYITKKRYIENATYFLWLGELLNEIYSKDHICCENHILFWQTFTHREEKDGSLLGLSNNSLEVPRNEYHTVNEKLSSWLNKNITLKWIRDGYINKKDISLLGKLITSEDIADCNKISEISDSFFFIHNARTDELTKHVKNSIEYLKKISQVVKILDKFLALKYSEYPSSSEKEHAESCNVIAIKILDDDGCLTKEAIEKADSLKKQLNL